MSLQFDPDFVADQVVILEAGLQEMGHRFLATSQKIGNLNTLLADKNAQLRSDKYFNISELKIFQYFKTENISVFKSKNISV